MFLLVTLLALLQRLQFEPYEGVVVVGGGGGGGRGGGGGGRGCGRHGNSPPSEGSLSVVCGRRLFHVLFEVLEVLGVFGGF